MESETRGFNVWQKYKVISFKGSDLNSYKEGRNVSISLHVSLEFSL
jgi:hypothetical protein